VRLEKNFVQDCVSLLLTDNLQRTSSLNQTSP
jgi:hypothetical protein